jgi:hypothetical protein
MEKSQSLNTVFQWGWRVALVVGAFWAGGLFDDWREGVSNERFARLEAGLLRYHEEHGAFPPQKYQPEPGGPIHSWRVLLAPYVDSGFAATHPKYDYDEWWINPRNLEAFGRRSPSFYRSNSKSYGGITHYLSVDEEDNWPSTRMLTTRLVKKGKDRFLLIEYPDSDIHWMEPIY